jgi:hypothetical protein
LEAEEEARASRGDSGKVQVWQQRKAARMGLERQEQEYLTAQSPVPAGVPIERLEAARAKVAATEAAIDGTRLDQRDRAIADWQIAKNALAALEREAEAN